MWWWHNRSCVKFSNVINNIDSNDRLDHCFQKCTITFFFSDLHLYGDKIFWKQLWEPGAAVLLFVSNSYRINITNKFGENQQLRLVPKEPDEKKGMQKALKEYEKTIMLVILSGKFLRIENQQYRYKGDNYGMLWNSWEMFEQNLQKALRPWKRKKKEKKM